MKKQKIEEIMLPSGYAADTLINGNISECIRYLNELLEYRATVFVWEELNDIKERCPEKFSYIKSKLHSA